MRKTKTKKSKRRGNLKRIEMNKRKKVNLKKKTESKRMENLEIRKDVKRTGVQSGIRG